MVDRAVDLRPVETLGLSYIDGSHFDQHTGWKVRKHHRAGLEWIGNSRSSRKAQPKSELARFICADKTALGPSEIRRRGMPP